MGSWRRRHISRAEVRKQGLESNEGAKRADTGREAFVAEGKASAKH